MAEGVLERARAVLARHWGHPDFRPGQAEAVAAAMAGRDVLAVLPTGGGKSVCYQVPALLGEGFVLVVSPLIALMHDQVAQLRARGVEATFIDSTLSARAVDQRWTDAEFGRYRLVYVAPERLLTERFLARADRLPVRLLAVDEAHCISEWGPHFRPSYLRLAEARAHLGHPPVMAVTATATPAVRRDIHEQLGLRDPLVVVRGFDRPNLVWSVLPVDDKRRKLLEIVEKVPGAGLVYCATRRGTEEWAAWLSAAGHPAGAYHGGLPATARAAAQQAWLAGTPRLMAATNAFGMGIDKPDVRLVVHVDLPASLEAYYQEAGRGGRDGRRAHAVLLHRKGDEATPRALLEASHPDGATVRRVYDAVCSLAQVAVGAEAEAPLAFDAARVARVAQCSAGQARMAVELLVRQGVFAEQRRRPGHVLIRFAQPPEALRRYAEGLSNARLAAFVRTLLRTVHAEAYTAWWEVDLRPLARRTGLEAERLRRGLDFLAEHGLLAWRGGTDRLLTLNAPRAARLPVDEQAVRRARRRAEGLLEDVLRYARSRACRRRYLLGYFGEEAAARCGRCDVCLGRHEPLVVTARDEPLLRCILEGVAAGTAPHACFETPPAHLDALLDWLVQEGYLAIGPFLEGRYVLTPRAHEWLAQWAPRP